MGTPPRGPREGSRGACGGGARAPGAGARLLTAVGHTGMKASATAATASTTRLRIAVV